jgi:Uncharacterised protein family (UPF0175)
LDFAFNYPLPMQVTLDIPDDMAGKLASHGQDPARAGLEAVAIEGFRSGALSAYQARRLLGFETRYELDGFLKAHSVWEHAYGLEDQVPGKEVYDPFVDPPLPVLEEGECSIAQPRGRYGDFALSLKLPGKLSPIVPMGEFVTICEFRAMMDRFDSEQEGSFWRSYYFSAYTTRLESGEIVVTFRCNENGIMFDLERGAWLAFRNPLGRAWEHPEVRRLWEDEVLRYGEF